MLTTHFRNGLLYLMRVTTKRFARATIGKLRRFSYILFLCINEKSIGR